MKTNLVRMAVLVLAAVTMAAPAFAGQTQAEREMSKGKEVGKVGSGTRGGSSNRRRCRRNHKA